MGWLHHHIYENHETVPIVTHTFPGDTPGDALKILYVHARYDEFLSAAVTTGLFRGMKLRTTTEWES
jgi:hypothetical protein